MNAMAMFDGFVELPDGILGVFTIFSHTFCSRIGGLILLRKLGDVTPKMGIYLDISGYELAGMVAGFKSPRLAVEI